jgi:hypothetical protein
MEKAKKDAEEAKKELSEEMKVRERMFGQVSALVDADYKREADAVKELVRQYEALAARIDKSGRARMEAQKGGLGDTETANALAGGRLMTELEQAETAKEVLALRAHEVEMGFARQKAEAEELAQGAIALRIHDIQRKLDRERRQEEEVARKKAEELQKQHEAYAFAHNIMSSFLSGGNVMDQIGNALGEIAGKSLADSLSKSMGSTGPAPWVASGGDHLGALPAHDLRQFDRQGAQQGYRFVCGLRRRVDARPDGDEVDFEQRQVPAPRRGSGLYRVG